MEYRNLDLTLISASGLKEVNKFRKMDVYAVAYIHGYPKTKKKTKADKNCGTSPTWNEKMQFIIDEHSLVASGLSLVVQFKADVMGPDKEIGEVTIPVPKLFDDCGRKPGVERLMEYQVKMSSGKVKGSLKLSYMFGEKYCSNNNSSDYRSNNSPTTAPAGYGQQPAAPNMVTSPNNNAAYHPGMEPYPPQPGMQTYPYPGASGSSGYYPQHPYSPPPSNNGYPSGYQSHPYPQQGPYSPQGHYGAYPPAGGHPQHMETNGYGGYGAPVHGAGYSPNGYGGYAQSPAPGAGYSPNGYGGYAQSPAPGAGYAYKQQPQQQQMMVNPHHYQQQQQPKKDNNGGKKEKKKSRMGKFGGGMGLGVLGVGAGLIGGLLLGEEMGDAFSGVGDMFSGAGEAVAGAGEMAFDAMGDVAAGAGEAVSAVGDMAAGAGEAVLGAAGDVVAGAGEAVAGAGEAVLGAAGDVVAGAGEMAASAVGDVAAGVGDVISSAGEAVVGAGEAVSGLAK